MTDQAFELLHVALVIGLVLAQTLKVFVKRGPPSEPGNGHVLQARLATLEHEVEGLRTWRHHEHATELQAWVNRFMPREVVEKDLSRLWAEVERLRDRLDADRRRRDDRQDDGR
jgi:hypothetical protein